MKILCDKSKINYLFIMVSLIFSFLVIVFMYSNTLGKDSEKKWLRGNLHTHTYWHGGRDFPENVAKWYQENGYDFVIFTEHNTIQDGEKWHVISEDHSSLKRYRHNFGEDWLEMRPQKGEKGYIQIRIKALDEYRKLFERKGKFLLMNGSEITDRHGVHLLAFHLDERIPTVGGTPEERERMIIDIVESVDDYRKRSGRNIYPVLAHPTWNWSITAETMTNVQNLRFFEVWNGVPEANNDGDKYHASTDRLWDIILAHRLGGMKGKPIYGLATDDAHDYDGGINGRNVGPGKGWVMVRSQKLGPEEILEALDQGDFYSTTGVILNDIQFNGENLFVEIEPQKDVTYLTEYIGTRIGFDTSSMPAVDLEGKEVENATRIYSEQIGEVLQSSHQLKSTYKLLGDELYVRVRITSTANQMDPITGDVIGIQKAWIQPQIPKRL